MALNILIIEDQDEKAKDILNFLEGILSTRSFKVKKSFKSGLKEITLKKRYDLIILDMSMPTFDPSNEDPIGGKPESFAGKKILQHMHLRKIYTPCIVISQYSQFDDGIITLDDLNKSLIQSYPEILMGTVYYTSAALKWRSDLSELLYKNGFELNV